MLSPSESPESLLTPDIKRFVYSQDWPKGHGLTIRLVDKTHPVDPLEPPHIKLVVFRDEMIRLSGEELQRVSSVTNTILSKLRKDGVPIFFDVEPTAKEDDDA